MSIAGIGPTGGAAQQKEGAGKIPSPEETFLAYMKKTPAERWVENWLASRGLTKDEFNALPPDQHDALAKEMAEDLKKALNGASDAHGARIDGLRQSRVTLILE